MKTLLKLKSDQDVTQLVRQARKSKDYTYILFTSPWDKLSNAVRERIESSKKEKDVYEVSYYDAPHSWLQFKVSPGTLVKMNAKKVVVYPSYGAVKLEF